MKAPFSNYLTGIAPAMKKLVAILRRDFDYVSVLSTDSVGLSIRMSQRSKTLSNSTLTTERGNVVRVYRGSLYSEYAFNDVDPDKIDELASRIRGDLDQQFSLIHDTKTKIYDTKKLADEPLELLVEKETGSLPEQTDLEELVARFELLSEEGMESVPHIIECMVTGSSTHISKMFITPNRYLRQSYVYAEGTVVSIAQENGRTETAYDGVSGCTGPDIFQSMANVVKKTAQTAEKMLKAEPIEPGTYDVITTPGVTGLIAHEAFGHGVEMDMFVKDRALAKDYIGKRVASDLVTMHEGALTDNSVTAYAFDDEGTLAGDVTEIDKGILKTGICDALSAVRLGIQPTGNGKRQNYEHKVYTRMTNTTFNSGTDSLEDMIASVDHGYLLESMNSGMEDPKHWGIQCIVARGYEIKDGKLTGRIVAPVVMTGYVPDLLGSITMASTDRHVDGNGMCGKGHKEWVKVADGGPYLKAKARLG